LINVARQFGLLSPHAHVTIIPADGRRYITDSNKQYSAILLDLPEPDTFQINRFYTSEFFARNQKILKEDGILSFSLIANPNYLSDVRIKNYPQFLTPLKNIFILFSSFRERKSISLQAIKLFPLIFLLN